MSKECEICKKTSTMAVVRTKLRGKYNPTNKKRKYPNLQSLLVPPTTRTKFKDFVGKKVTACTKCIKTLAKTK